jgi:hypothetical protein
MIYISDEELAALPDDEEVAFVKFERLARERLDAEISTYEETPKSLLGNYMNVVLTGAKHFNIFLADTWVQTIEGERPWDHYSDFTTAIDNLTLEIRLRKIEQAKRESVALDPAVKLKVRHHLEQIRTIVDQANLPTDKKDALSKCINALASEIDRERTKTQAAGNLFIQVCGYIGEGANKLKPAVKLIERISQAIGVAQNKEAQHRLSPPNKQLEPPKAVSSGDRENASGFAPSNDFRSKANKLDLQKTIKEEIPF